MIIILVVLIIATFVQPMTPEAATYDRVQLLSYGGYRCCRTALYWGRHDMVRKGHAGDQRSWTWAAWVTSLGKESGSLCVPLALPMEWHTRA